MKRCRQARDLLGEAQRAIERHGLIHKGDRVIAAVSGGADSVALLHLLKRLSNEFPFTIQVVHVDHGLRGRASGADARFVERLAASLELPCRVEHLSLRKKASPAGKNASPESEWREARYRVLCRHARRRGAAAIALGHHLDDLAETVLMRITRGAGAHGLAAFGPKSEWGGVALIRPLYHVSRARIESYCEEQGLKWRVDASNADRRRLRNHVRLDLIPYLEKEFNPSIREGLFRLAETSRVDDEHLDFLAHKEWRWMTCGQRGAPKEFAVRTLANLPLAILRRVARLWLAAVARSAYPPVFSEACRLTELILEKQSGARFELQRRWAFVRETDRIIVKTLRRRKTK